MSDDESFADFLAGGVRKLDKPARVLLDRAGDVRVDKRRRREAAAAADPGAMDPLDRMPSVMVEPLSLLNFHRPGVQQGVLRNLRLGKYQIDASIDLHGMTVEQARIALFQFVGDCTANDVRTALVTHGKGLGRQPPALLKSCVAHWLSQMPTILAFHTAQKHHGSYGATYVLLKKSDRKREQAKRDIARRR